MIGALCSCPAPGDIMIFTVERNLPLPAGRPQVSSSLLTNKYHHHHHPLSRFFVSFYSIGQYNTVLRCVVQYIEMMSFKALFEDGSGTA